jgi:hypothetical protein
VASAVSGLENPSPPAPSDDVVRPPASDVHGHALLERMLPPVAGQVDHGYIVEVGTTREKVSGQGSTLVLAALAARLGLPFLTIDIDPMNTEQATADMDGIPNARAVTAKGEDFLAEFDQPVVAAYLDAFDIQHGQHSEYRIERYRRLLGLEITNDGAAAMHLACARALTRRVVVGGLVVIDDTWLRGGRYAGKGRDAVPFLLGNGFGIVARTKTAVALQRETVVEQAVHRVRWCAHRAVRAARRITRRVARPADSAS